MVDPEIRRLLEAFPSREMKLATEIRGYAAQRTRQIALPLMGRLIESFPVIEIDDAPPSDPPRISRMPGIILNNEQDSASSARSVILTRYNLFSYLNFRRPDPYNPGSSREYPLRTTAETSDDLWLSHGVEALMELHGIDCQLQAINVRPLAGSVDSQTASVRVLPSNAEL